MDAAMSTCTTLFLLCAFVTTAALMWKLFYLVPSWKSGGNAPWFTFYKILDKLHEFAARRPSGIGAGTVGGHQAPLPYRCYTSLQVNHLDLLINIINTIACAFCAFSKTSAWEQVSYWGYQLAFLIKCVYVCLWGLWLHQKKKRDAPE